MSVSRCLYRVFLGLFLLGGGVYYLVYGDGGMWESAKAVFLSLVGLVYLLLVYSDCVEKKPHRLRPEERLAPVELEAELPWSTLSARFCACAPKDEGMSVEEPEHALGWHEPATGELQLLRRMDANGTASEDWYALWWAKSIDLGVDSRGHACVRAAKPRASLTPEEVATLCAQHGLSLPESLKQNEPTGLAFYHSGKLALYPAPYLPDFTDSFLETMLAPEADYREWAEAYYAEEDADEDEKV